MHCSGDNASWRVTLALGGGRVHWGHAGWSRTQAEIRTEIERHTLEAPVVITNWGATGKFIDLMRSPHIPMRRDSLTREGVESLLRRHGKVVLVLLDRADSEYWREDSRRNEAFLTSLRRNPTVELDRAVTSTDRLRIYTLESQPPR